MASRGCSISGSLTVSQRMSSLPCQTSAFMRAPLRATADPPRHRGNKNTDSLFRTRPQFSGGFLSGRFPCGAPPRASNSRSRWPLPRQPGGVPMDQLEAREAKVREGGDARRLAIVTGASTGIGYELARHCAENGFDVIVAAD